MDDHGQNDPEPVRPEDSMTTQPEQKPNARPKEEQQSESILLRDLAPRASVKGGAGKLRFGESTVAEAEEMP